MIRNEPESAAQDMPSQTWWTPRRTKLTGLIGALGGLLGALGVAGSSLGMGIGSIAGIIYPVCHVLVAVALLAANARYGTSYGRGGRSVAVVLALSLVSYAVSIIILLVGHTLLGDLLLPTGVLTGAAYMAIRTFGSLYGISLWRHTSASRLTAGLFIVLLPSIFILGPLTQIGFPGSWIGAGLYLAFIALGYDIWTDLDTSVDENRRSES